MTPADGHPSGTTQGSSDNGNLLSVRHEGYTVEHAGDEHSAVLRPGLDLIQELNSNLQALFLVDFITHSDEIGLKGRNSNPSLAERPGVVQFPGSKVHYAGSIVPFPCFQGRTLQLAKVPARIGRKHAFEKTISQGSVPGGVRFPCSALPHKAIEPQIVRIATLHIEIHRQQIEHGGCKCLLFRTDLDAGDHLSLSLDCHLEATNPVDDVPSLPDDNRHRAPDSSLQ